MPSSQVSEPEEDRGCVEGVLIEIETEGQAERRALEVCLADEEGEERDLITWEKILNEGENVRAFQITTELPGEKVEKAVQTEPMVELADAAGLLKDFPNLRSGGGPLPDPVGK